MLFSSNLFLLLFLPLVLLGYYQPLFKGRTFRNRFLLASSLVFYAWGEPVFVFIMCAGILVNWALALRMDKQTGGTRKRTLGLAIGIDVLLLFVCKYTNFAMQNLGLLLGTDPLFIAPWGLPLGVSFYTFQIMSYVIDIYRGKAAPQKSLLDCALYISLFPQLVAGPIVRYDAIAAQIANRKESWDDFVAGFTRFVVGLAKKLLIADQCAPLADAAFAQNADGMLGLPMAWLGALAYTLQIFFDFSGYSDMAIGLGRMFGFRFAENFNYPYISRSATEFWRRWHISLGSFFRDYVYFPLGGSRCSKKRLVLNLFVVWTLTGLWHGANWTFVFWGWLYFVLLTFEKLSGFSSVPVGARHALPLRYLYALFFIVMGWVLFRAENLGLAVDYYQAMFGISASLNDQTFSAQVSWIPIALGVLFSVPLMPKLRERIGANLAWRIAEPIVMLCLFALCLIASTANEYQPFIYFNF